MAVVALLLGACGFHLRGSAPLPAEMSVTYIQGTSEFDPLYDDFRTALESRGARVTQDRGEATAVLNILENNTDTDVLTVDLSGKALEYRYQPEHSFRGHRRGRPVAGRPAVRHTEPGRSSSTSMVCWARNAKGRRSGRN